MFGHDSLRFTPLRHWTSPVSGTHYPIQQQIDYPAGRFTLQALVELTGYADALQLG